MRDDLYRAISQDLGYEYHTAELRTVDEARRVWKIIRKHTHDARGIVE